MRIAKPLGKEEIKKKDMDNKLKAHIEETVKLLDTPINTISATGTLDSPMYQRDLQSPTRNKEIGDSPDKKD